VDFFDCGAKQPEDAKQRFIPQQIEVRAKISRRREKIPLLSVMAIVSEQQLCS